MNTQINKEQAIAIMYNILREGCAIPMASIGNGGCGFSYVGPILMVKDLSWYLSQLKDKTFRIVPTSEVSEEFSDCDLNSYDVCVEFKNTTGDYSGSSYYGTSTISKTDITNVSIKLGDKI